MLSAIIFDFDGTIADTLQSARVVLNDLSDEFGFAPIAANEVEALRSHTVDSLIKHLGIKRRHVPVILAKGVRALRSRISDIPPCPGMIETLSSMSTQAEHFGILTSNSQENVQLFLEAHGVADLFTFISSTSKLKGKARYLKSIARTFSLAPEDMLYIGDEVRDVVAANKAGVPNIAVTWGFNSREALESSSPTHIVNNPGELLAIIR